MQKKRIYVAFTGGTLGMQPSPQGYQPVAGYLPKALQQLPQLQHSAMPDLRYIALFTQRRWGKEQLNIDLKQFDDSFWLLVENPDIGKSCDEVRDGYRKFLQGIHVIFYQQTGSQQIRVVRILHKSMDVNPSFGE